jgi:hypothetical protein
LLARCRLRVIYESQQRVVVPARIVPAGYKLSDNPDDRPGVSMEPKYTFTAGKPFQCVEGSELHQFVRSSQLFRRVSSSELQVNGDGSVISIEPAEKILAAHDRASTVNEDAEEAIRCESNASWSDVEVTEVGKAHASCKPRRQARRQ